MPLTTGSATVAKTIGIVRVSRWTATVGAPHCQYDVGVQTDQLLRERSYPTGVIASPTNVHPNVAGIAPTQVRNRLSERRNVSLPQGIVFVARHEHADPCNSV